MVDKSEIQAELQTILLFFISCFSLCPIRYRQTTFVILYAEVKISNKLDDRHVLVAKKLHCSKTSEFQTRKFLIIIICLIIFSTL